MKSRARFLTRFASWFFNTSPEWVARDKHVDSAGVLQPEEQQQVPQSGPDQGDAAASEAPDPDPNQPRGR